MEHLGDAVAGRYVLVAPQPARAARRQYHAVDMLADRMVTVRFEPLTPADLPGMARLKTRDGQRVLDGGTFEGSYYVVVDCADRPIDLRDDVSVAELEAMFAAPSTSDIPVIETNFAELAPETQALGPKALLRNALVSMIEIAGGVAIVVLLVAAAYLALGGRPDAPAPRGADAVTEAPERHPRQAPAEPAGPTAGRGG